MRTRRPLAAVASLFLLLAIPATALAGDETGSAGTVSSVEVLTPSADTYLQYHGRVIVQTGKTTKTEYRWGGVSCGTRVLAADMIEVLVEASRNNAVLITPVFQIGQGDAKCVVGFTVAPRR